MDAVKPHLDVYIALQEINRTVEAPKVLLLPGVSGRVAADAADLHRLALFTLQTDAFSVTAANALGLTAHLRTVDSDAARAMSWAAVVGRAGGAHDAQVFNAETKILVG